MRHFRFGKQKWVVVSALLLAGILGGWKIIQLRKTVQLALDSSRLEKRRQQSIKLHRRLIVPQAKPGFSLLHARLQLDGVALFHDDFFISTNEGILQLDLTGKEMQRYTALDGLPGHRFTAMEVSAEALWLGNAPQGLLRFDGEKFEYYFADRAEDFETTSLLALPSGDLLVGTKQRGLLRFKGGDAQEFDPRIGAKFISVLQGDDHRLVVGTFSDGVYVLERGVIEHFDMESAEPLNLPDNQVTALATDDRSIYVGTPLGVAEITSDHVARIFAKDLTVLSMAAAPRMVLLGTNSGLFGFSSDPSEKSGRQSYSAQTLERLNVAADRPFTRRFGLMGPIDRLVKAGADIWLALSGDGVYVCDFLAGSSWRLVKGFSQDHSGLTDTNVSALASDRQQSLWIGYFDRGIDVMNSDGTRKKHEENDRIFCVNHITELPDGRVAVSTANGLGLYQAGSLSQFLTEKDGLAHQSVAMVYPLADDKAIAATAEGVSVLFRGTPIQSLFALHGLANNHVYCAAWFADKIYLGTLGGITVIEGSGISSSKTISNSGLKANWITSLAPSERQLFVASYGGGVQSVDRLGQWTDYSAFTGPVEVNSNAMLVDGNQLYVGTLDQGILIYDLTRDRWGHLREGLPSQNITAFAIRADSLLVGTDRGIVKIERSVLRGIL